MLNLKDAQKLLKERNVLTLQFQHDDGALEYKTVKDVKTLKSMFFLMEDCVITVKSEQ